MLLDLLDRRPVNEIVREHLDDQVLELVGELVVLVLNNVLDVLVT